MFNIFDRVLEAKGTGWSVLRFAFILAPAVVALVVLNMFFRLDYRVLDDRSEVIRRQAD